MTAEQLARYKKGRRAYAEGYLNALHHRRELGRTLSLAALAFVRTEHIATPEDAAKGELPEWEIGAWRTGYLHGCP